MDKMTASEAIATMRQFEMLDDEQIDEIAALIAQQQQQIEQQAAEISKKDKLIATACEKIIDIIKMHPPSGSGLCPFSLGLARDCFVECNDQFDECWLAWLEKEAQGV